MSIVKYELFILIYYYLYINEDSSQKATRYQEEYPIKLLEATLENCTRLEEIKIIILLNIY